MPERNHNKFWDRIFIGACCSLVAIAMLFSSGCQMKRAKYMYGVISDVRYSQGNPKSLQTLGETVKLFNSKDMIDSASYIGYHRKPSFVIQLGNIIDGGTNSKSDLATVLATFNKIKARKYHVLGKKDVSNINRGALLKKLSMKRAYYDFAKGKFRFVVLDMTEKSSIGGIGNEQKSWLKKILSKALKKKRKVVIFGDYPIVGGQDKYKLSGSDEIAEILKSYDCVFAYISGHPEVDSYAYKDSIYYVNIEPMANAAGKKVYAMVWVYNDRLEIESTGKVHKLTLPFDTGLSEQ